MRLAALKIRGPFKGPSGYEHHVRAFAREFRRLGVAVELIDLPEWGPVKLPPHLRDPWFESLDEPTGAKVVLHFCMPHQVVAERGKVNVNHTMFEASPAPATWIARNLTHDLVVVPTESSRRAWMDPGFPAAKIRVCPLGVDPVLFGGQIAPLPLLDDGAAVTQYRVRFLNVSELGPRKNLAGLLRAWLRATTRDDNAILIVKLGCYTPGWRELFHRQLAAVQARIGKRLDDAAPVHFVEDLFADAEMPRLYAAATHYLSLSFGEGWDQAMVEAAAAGLSLIAPEHSAYPAYLDATCARLIPSRAVEATFPPGSGFERLFAGATWWEPDEEVAIAAIRAAIDSCDADLASPRERILRELTWEQATRRLLAILDETATTAARRRFWPRLPWSSNA